MAADWCVEVGLVMVLFDEPIVDSLMIAFEVVVFGELVRLEFVSFTSVQR